MLLHLELVCGGVHQGSSLSVRVAAYMTFVYEYVYYTHTLLIA
jgi:hypothetical protein